jgi:hypothetical protein
MLLRDRVVADADDVVELDKQIGPGRTEEQKREDEKREECFYK